MLEALGIKYSPRDRRLFTNLHKTCLKGYLLYKGNSKPKFYVGYAPYIKETYENIKHTLQCIKQNEHQWQLCDDLKVVFVMALQRGHTKYCCFLCDNNSCRRGSFYIMINWPLHQSLEAEIKNVQYSSFTDQINFATSNTGKTGVYEDCKTLEYKTCKTKIFLTERS